MIIETGHCRLDELVPVFFSSPGLKLKFIFGLLQLFGIEPRRELNGAEAYQHSCSLMTEGTLLKQTSVVHPIISEWGESMQLVTFALNSKIDDKLS